MPGLHNKQIKLKLQAVPKWSKRAQTILRTFKFDGFLKGNRLLNKTLTGEKMKAAFGETPNAATGTVALPISVSGESTC